MKKVTDLWERSKMLVWSLFLFNLILFLLAVIFANQIGFSTALKGSIALGLIMTIVFLSIFILYELAVFAGKYVTKKKGRNNIDCIF
ncbi:MAG: hypothetical protein AB1499_15415 [Nitrospirota bacterium]